MITPRSFFLDTIKSGGLYTYKTCITYIND
jgi:hypothetical protein